ncbi:MAG: HipA domain-containing protein [Bacteroidales bacterium]|nr:HipA domain-containing protein [Bacteroidales bacterium]
MSEKCLYCYQENNSDVKDYHPSCSKKLYGGEEPPILDYSFSEMSKLAEKVISNSVTVPGVQAKLSLHLDKKGSRPSKLTLVGLWGDYILKPPTAKYPQLPENEDLSMHLADIFKIKVVPHSLIRLKSNELAYITKRVDRDKKGKMHMEDFCQLSERLTEDKYKASMEQVGKLILKYSSNPLLDALTFFEVTIFSFLTGNADMHLKNFSLLDYRNGLTGLSPAYDLLSTRLVVPEKEDNEEMALTLNGRKRNFKVQDFLVFGERLKLTEKQVQNSLTKFSKQLDKVLNFVDFSFLSADFKEEYKELIQKRAERLEL